MENKINEKIKGKINKEKRKNRIGKEKTITQIYKLGYEKHTELIYG
jgi:hypothetical protein